MNELFWWYQIILCPLSLSVPDEQTPYFFFYAFLDLWEELCFGRKLNF